MTKLKMIIQSAAGCILLLASAVTAPAGSLAGAWRFQLDPDDVGVVNHWYDQALARKIQLPGALQNQGFGEDIRIDTKWTGDVGADRWLKGPQYEPYRQPGHIKVPFFLQPEKHYVGAAWYQRSLEIPAGWAGQRVVLTLERPHWETRVWVDGALIGTNASLSTPHVFDLGTGLKPGKHQLTMRVDNRLIVDVGSWSHSVSDHTQGNWNGVAGDITLSTTSPVWIEDAQVYPSLARKSARVKVKIGNATGQTGEGTLTANIQLSHPNTRGGAAAQAPLKIETAVKWAEQGGDAEFEVLLGDQAALWDEFNPNLYELSLRLSPAGGKPGSASERKITFGLREIATADRGFLINGRKTFLRGTLECCIFPLTGYPPTDLASWKRIIRIAKEHGLNHIRFHSWCPPEAAFIAADELGFYFHVECAAWANVGSGHTVDQWLYQEGGRITRAYGNHPSFVLMAYGNEPSGAKHKEWLTQWVAYWKQQDSRRLYTSGAGWPALDENQYHVTPAPRGPKGWLGKDYRADVVSGRTRRDAVQTMDAPVIVHEMGQWCVYPNFDEGKKYTGPLKAKNFEIFRDSLAGHGMLDQWRDFLKASGKLQALCYKEEIEAAMRTPGIAGVQLLDLHDFPGQGTALVGVLDPFWDGKGYISAAEFRRFYNSTVPLARLLKRTWTSDETLTADVEIAHYGPAPLEKAVTSWKILNESGKAVAGGAFAAKTLPLGSGNSVGQVSLELSKLPAPKAYKLVVGLDGTPFENDWNFWVYPAAPAGHSPEDVLVAGSLDDAALSKLAEGGKVLLASAKLSPAHPKLGFEPIFWNKYMFNTQGRTTLGLVCDPKHPALALFPTGFWQDWQWNDIVSNARGIILDEFPKGLRPIVQPIDDWNSNRKLGLVFECRVGAGKLLVCSADLAKNLDKRPAARQLRESLLAYAGSARFNPGVAVAKDDLVRVLHWASKSKLVNLGAKILSASSEDREHGNVAANLIDGNLETFWHSKWSPQNDPMPHVVVLDLGREVTLKGVTCLPRQDMDNGRIAACEFYCSNDPKTWGEPAAKAKWRNTDQWQTVTFAQPVKARYLKWVVTGEINKKPFAALAELDVITESEKSPGLSQSNGVVLRDGQPYRGVGCNYFDLFLRVLHHPTNTTSLEGLRRLGETGLPFVRFAVAYDNNDWKVFFDNREEFFRCLDLVVNAAERAKVGLVPSFFWSFQSFPRLANESCDQWGDPESKTSALMRQVVAALVERYKKSPALWAWEFGNEANLMADLPNAAQLRKKGGTERDDLTAKTMVVMLRGFAKEVRRHDAHRLIIAGHSHPRAAAWHNTADKSWKSDSQEQTLEILRRDNPAPLDTIAIHAYADHPVSKEMAAWATNHADYLRTVRALSREMKRPVFVGEFGLAAQADEADTRAKFERLLADLEQTEMDLAAFWVFDLGSQSKDWSVTFDNARAYMLQLTAEANRRWNKAAGQSHP